MTRVPAPTSLIPPPLPGCTPLFDAAATREADARATRDHRLPSILLMERAGLTTAELIRDRFPDSRAVRILVGPGNNGGDGMVIARHLSERGWEVRVEAPGAREPAGADASVMVAAAATLGIPVQPFTPAPPRPGEVLVDALLGTGASGPPRGPLGEAVAWLAGLDHDRIVAVDIPSGVLADTGEVPAPAPRAALTATYHADMVGLRVAPGRGHAGEVVVVDIGIPSKVGLTPAAWLAGAGAAAAIPAKGAAADKYRSGAVLVVGGATGLTGAPALAARATLRAGAGLTVAAVPAAVQPAVAAQLLEVMCAPLPDEGGHLTAAATAEVAAQSRRVDALAIGPGLGRAEATTPVVLTVLKRILLPAVVDADGLWHLGDEPERIAGRPAPTVLTPHAGEAARLLGVSREDVEARRLDAARTLARRSGAVVVLKGPGTISAAPDGTTIVNDTGSATLATAGSGDVLTGIVAAALAKGMPPLAAAAASVALHGLAGDLAGHGDGTVASDVIAALPAARAAAREAA